MQAWQRWPGHARDLHDAEQAQVPPGVGRPSPGEAGGEAGVAAAGVALGTLGGGVEAVGGSRQPLKGLQVGLLLSRCRTRSQS